MPIASTSLYRYRAFRMWNISLLTSFFQNIKNEFQKIYVYSPSLHQTLYQKLIKCFSNYIPTSKIANVLNEENLDLVVDEIVKDKDFQKSETGLETYESVEEVKHPQEEEDGGLVMLNDLNEKGMNDPWRKALFKRSVHNSFSVFIISQDYYELQKRTIRANGSI